MTDKISWTAVGVIVSILALCLTIGGGTVAMVSSVKQVEVTLSEKITTGDAALTEKVNIVQNQLGVVMASQIQDLPQRIALLEQANSAGERYTRGHAEARIAQESAEFKAVWKEIERLKLTQELGEREIRAWLKRLRDDLTTHLESPTKDS